ncbi:MAG: DUF1176 domain-containing protein [Limnothrix sp.]
MNHQFIFPLAALMCGSLISCSPAIQESSDVAPAPTSNSVDPTMTTDPATTDPEGVTIARIVEGEEKAKIFDEVLNARTEIGLCADGDDLSENLEYSEVYARDTEYLVQVLCFQAAYQGNYEFVHLNTVEVPFNTTEAPFEISKAKMYLAGYPTFDPATGIISNSYKLIGAGTCFESSQHYWDGYSLQLISSTLEDGIENGCADLGVRSPAADQLITATGVGMAKLGMTLGELKQLLPEGYTVQPTELGVDLPPAMQVSFYDAAQFDLAFSDEDTSITNQSKIEMIVVRSPMYRTAEGVGPGTPLKQAIAQYGAATLSYNTETESRESIEFADGLFPKTTDSSIWLRSNQWTVTDFAGIYPDSTESYQQTQAYHDHAAIASIWLIGNP